MPSSFGSRSIESIGPCHSIMSSAEDEEEYTFVQEKDKEVDLNEQVPVTKDTKVDDKDGEKGRKQLQWCRWREWRERDAQVGEHGLWGHGRGEAPTSAGRLVWAPYRSQQHVVWQVPLLKPDERRCHGQNMSKLILGMHFSVESLQEQSRAAASCRFETRLESTETILRHWSMKRRNCRSLQSLGSAASMIPKTLTRCLS